MIRTTSASKDIRAPTNVGLSISISLVAYVQIIIVVLSLALKSPDLKNPH